MVGRTVLLLCAAWPLTWAGPALAEPYLMAISISAGPLPSGLQTLERQTGIELLFDHALVSGLQSPEVRGELTAEAALRELLAETRLTVRRAGSGAWIIEPTAAPPLARPDAIVPEILVIGARTQNADIRRFENDVQPYTVVTKAQIIGAHRDTIDQYFTSRITANTQSVPADRSQSAETLSAIDLRGLGPDGTLVLIDGRRMPSIPSSPSAFRQSDVNAIPLHAVERIEVLTGTAGGIHGFGALGGVVNVVLDRDTRGIDFHVTEAISSRWDAPRHGFEARFGHTSRDGATDFVLFGAHTRTDTVLVGARDYEIRDRLRTFELIPQSRPDRGRQVNAVRVRSVFRFNPETGEFVIQPNLVFKPEFGGATLPSSETFLPVGFSGSAETLAASLTRHAGQEDFSLTDDEASDDLGSNPRSEAVLASVRHRFGAGLEAYADAVVLRSHGESHGDRLRLGFSQGKAFLSPESPANPFTDYLDVDFPIEHLDHEVRKRAESTRYTAGLAADLPFDWRGTAEISAGSFRHAALASSEVVIASSLSLLGDPSDLETNPLGDWQTFQRAIGGDRSRTTLTSGLRTRFRDQSLRLAGPLFRSGPHPATVTVLAEHRADSLPAYTEWLTTTSATASTTSETSVAAHSTETTSLYAELRAPLFAEQAPLPVLRGLELQLAIRHDDEKDSFLRDPFDRTSDRIHAAFTGTTYTAGAKISPTHWLMIRGSYATGEQPPPLSDLIELEPLTATLAQFEDPKRGGRDPGEDGEFLLEYGGKADLKAVRASTLFLGAVMTPFGEDGLRIATDFSRIRRNRDVVTSLSPADVLSHEDFWAGRVERAPLTEEDRANGYTAGRVTLIDTRYSNDGALKVDALDLRLGQPLRLWGGRLHLYADATWYLRKVQKAPFEPDVDWAGYVDGPLKWRANGGFEWSTERLTIGANAQYFDSSLVIQENGPLAGANDLLVEMQGSRKISSQWYLDLHGAWRIAARNVGLVKDLTVDFGIVNVLDREPPRETSFIEPGPGYSRYGDPRQRRFEVGLSTHF